jgi:hypothetical protein
MKALTLMVCLLLPGALIAQSVSSDQSKTAGEPVKVDKQKEADIRQLLEITGSKAMAAQMMSNMEGSIKPLMANAFPAGAYRDKLVDLFFAKFHSKLDPQQLVDMAVPVYDKHFTDEEIKGLIQFYQTPVGKKALSELPQIVTQLQESGKSWGQQVGRESMIEVLQENPDLAQALREAQQPQLPK